MKTIIYIKALFIFLLLLGSCSKKDDDTCLKNENRARVEFDGKVLEPKYIFGFTPGYTFYIDRNRENYKDWNLKFASNDGETVSLTILDVEGIGSYAIKDGVVDYLISFPSYENTFIHLKNNNDFSDLYYSINNTGSIKITEYNSDLGILVGSFSCKMASAIDSSNVKIITGKFNINQSTFKNERPCWY